MNKIKAIYKLNDEIQINNKLINKDSYITKDFVLKLHNESDKVKYSSDYVNEIFLNYYINGYIYKNMFVDHRIDKVEINSSNLNSKVFLSKAIESKINIHFVSLFLYKVTSILKIFLSITISFFLSFFLSVYVLFRYKKNTDKDNEYDKNFSVIRTKSTDEKIKTLQNQFNIKFFVDDLIYKNTNYNSLYSASFFSRLRAIVKIPLITMLDIYFIYKDSRQLFEKYFFGHLLYHYAVRLAFKSIYEYYLETLMKSKNKTYYTGNKEDRYAICEKKISKRYLIKTVCFPHGLEYSFKEPAGLVGDTFYCITDQSQKVLSSIYTDNNFIYDINIVKKMFIKESDNNFIENEVVFFTETRTSNDILINQQIIESILVNSKKVFLKLHPKDDIKNYNKFNDKIIVLNDINDAITNNICIARKSTILVEALYNNSISIAILINDLDKNILENYFPSLNDNKIQKIYSLLDLSNYILQRNQELKEK